MIADVLTITSASSFKFRRAVMIDFPSFERMPEAHKSQDQWVPYPASFQSVLAHTNCALKSELDLDFILARVSLYFFRKYDPRPYGEVLETVGRFYERLKLWFLELPSCIALDQGPTPAVIDMQ
jgi:hypothetical protein